MSIGNWQFYNLTKKSSVWNGGGTAAMRLKVKDNYYFARLWSGIWPPQYLQNIFFWLNQIYPFPKKFAISMRSVMVWISNVSQSHVLKADLQMKLPSCVAVGGRPSFRRHFFFFSGDSELVKARPPMRQFWPWFDDVVLGFLVCCAIKSLCHTPPTMTYFSVPIPPY